MNLVIFVQSLKIKLKAICVLLGLLRKEKNWVNDKCIQLCKKIIIGNKSNKEKKLLLGIEYQRRQMANSEELIEIAIGYNAPEEDYDKIRTEMSPVGRATTISSMKKPWALVLYETVKCFKPKICFELGTNVGISASYQGAALKSNNVGRLTTFEMSRSKVDIANHLFKEVGLDNIETICGKFQDTLEEELKKKKPIDYIFIDGHHEKAATIQYFNQVSPYLADNAVVIFDDIIWSAGMKEAWAILEKDTRFSVAIEFKRIGICIFRGSS